MGLGPDLELRYGPTHHKGFENVYPTVVGKGAALQLTNWSTLAK